MTAEIVRNCVSIGGDVLSIKLPDRLRSGIYSKWRVPYLILFENIRPRVEIGRYLEHVQEMLSFQDMKLSETARIAMSKCIKLHEYHWKLNEI